MYFYIECENPQILESVTCAVDVDADGFYRDKEGFVIYIDELLEEGTLPTESELHPDKNPEPLHVLDTRVKITPACDESRGWFEKFSPTTEPTAKKETPRVCLKHQVFRPDCDVCQAVLERVAASNPHKTGQPALWQASVERTLERSMGGWEPTDKADSLTEAIASMDVPEPVPGPDLTNPDPEGDMGEDEGTLWTCQCGTEHYDFPQFDMLTTCQNCGQSL